MLEEADKLQTSNKMESTMIIVLDDGETFSAADGCVLAELTDEGMEMLHNDRKYDSDDMVQHITVEITLADLIDAYNIVHGTKY